MRTLSRPWTYAGAIGATIVAGALQAAIWPYIPPSPQLLFYPTVVVVASVGGCAPGLVATATSTLIMVFYFIPPVRSFVIDGAGDAVDLAIFAVVSALLTVLIARTRTAERAATAARVRAEHATDIKNRVLAVVSHDLKTPLAAIALGAQSIDRALERGDLPATRSYVDRILRSARRADALVADVLEVATIAPQQLRLVFSEATLESIVTEVHEVVQPLAESRGVVVNESWDDAHVTCDRTRIVRALTNLVGNAVRFTPRGGCVTIVAERLATARVRFSVRDTGAGIAPEQLPHIFQPGWRGESSDGHGLGLGIARSIVEAHGGALEVESAMGRGSVFRFDLATPVPVPATTASPSPPMPALRASRRAPSSPK